ncbi:Protoporphyrinogen IX dehydrogenase [menaquinone] [Candidatus Gullanella endobia]|uniref:Protoporphyrinogen IX dehydrogenase [quinone] n=1 Tax=Candidatus Gullanella endobia TaxID=1070130 RepID=A0A143WRF3_9ENTR|nr:menaquinone-dependent protoporphyrinogen IX dehydrogenase [Candidatus Gullanella endobia]CUX96290.1 Protoporphyrinogen IX dehydrogenase [menaquinone] [Candidatus Gullanella endobia]
MKTLILYLSRDGQTHKIARTIAAHLTNYCKCKVIDLNFAYDLDLKSYQRVVIGAAIHYGCFDANLDRFIAQRLDWLNSIPSAFYSVSLMARKPDKCTQTTNTYTKKFLANTPWCPDLCAIFSGALYYPRYRWFDRVIIQVIMYITGGETDQTKEVEYTDWQQVSSFASNLVQLTTKNRKIKH